MGLECRNEQMELMGTTRKGIGVATILREREREIFSGGGQLRGGVKGYCLNAILEESYTATPIYDLFIILLLLLSTVVTILELPCMKMVLVSPNTII